MKLRDIFEMVPELRNCTKNSVDYDTIIIYILFLLYRNMIMEIQDSAKPQMTYERLKEITTVHTVTRPNLRTDEFFVFVGQLFLIELFDTNKDMTPYTDVSLQYPERWLNILEQRALFTAVQWKCPYLKKLHIKTHSAFIIQSAPDGTVFIVDKPDTYPEITYIPGVRYSPVDSYDGGLMAFGGTITSSTY